MVGEEKNETGQERKTKVASKQSTAGDEFKKREHDDKAEDSRRCNCPLFLDIVGVRATI